jgi:hypothetical protein
MPTPKPKTPTRAVGSMRKLSDVVKPKATAKPTSKATLKATVKPKPAPSPTSLSQLKNTMGTMMNVKPGKEGTKEDKNIYRGSYGGKEWVWKNGKATLK